MEAGSPPTISPLLLRNLLTSIFIYADKSLLNLGGEKYKLLQFIRYLLLSFFIFFFRLLPPLFLNPNSHEKNYNYNYSFKFGPKADEKLNSADSSIARALSQLLSIMNGIPVSSRKYETVRSLAEKLIDDNLKEQEGYPILQEINCTALSAAFSRTLSQLEARAAVMDEDVDRSGGVHIGDTNDGTKRDYNYKLSRVLRAVWYYGEAAWSRLGKSELNKSGKSAEKLSAELLWLAQKLAKNGSVEEGVHKWASASKLAWLALSAEPRLQGSLLKVSVFLLKQAKEIGGNKEDEDEKEQKRQTKLKLLISWLPLLCRASNGTDTPVLSINEKAELEKILEDLIEGLEEEEEQEKVLSLWLHHFTHCPSSDWPNLHGCYARWCTASRRLLLLQR